MATELRAVSRAQVRLASRRFGDAVDGVATLMRCRTPQDWMAARAALLCQYLDLVRDSYDVASEIVADAAGGAVRATTPRS